MSSRTIADLTQIYPIIFLGKMWICHMSEAPFDMEPGGGPVEPKSCEDLDMEVS